MLDKFSWLHLSDFHFRAEGDPFSQDVSAKKILSDIPSRLSDEYPLQFVVVTGDVAFSGKSDEYEIAAEFFESLAGKLGLNLNRIFVAPGNHDVNRSLQALLYEQVQQELTNQQAVDDFLGNSVDRTYLMERQAAFRAFRDQLFFDDSICATEEGLARVGGFDLDGLRVCVLELNSAWLSGSNDQAGKLIIGERQMINALGVADRYRPHLKIALAHHPTEWMSEFDQLSCKGWLLKLLDILHTGHLHRPEVSVRLMPSSECLLVAAGSSHASRHYVNSYNVVEFEVGAGKCRVRIFEYQPESGEFEELPSTEHKMTLGGELDVGSGEIAGVIRDIEPVASPYADYLAALLTGEMYDVPIKLGNGSYIFGSRDLPSEFQFTEVHEFLRVSNMLRTYGDIALEERLSNHRDAIAELSLLLRQIVDSSPDFAGALSSRVTQAQKLAENRDQEVPRQVQHLDELVNSGKWGALAEASSRYLKSSLEEVRIAANRGLTFALIRSEERSDREDGFTSACENLDEPWADASDYMLASAGAESLGELDRAISIALCALERWPSESGLLKYCRSLAMQTGNQVLRRRMEETGGSSQ